MVKHLLGVIFLICAIITHGSALHCYVCEDIEPGNCFNDNDGDLKEYEFECSPLPTTPISTTETPTTSREAPTTIQEIPTETETPVITDRATGPEEPSVVQIRQRRYVKETEEEFKCFVIFVKVNEKSHVQRGCLKAEDADQFCAGIEDCRTCSGNLCNADGRIN